MKKHDFGKPLCRLIMAVAMMMLSLQAMAYDFSYIYQGKTLYYNITSDSTVEVTYTYISGDVVIPSTVIYDGTTYSVTSIGYNAFYSCSGLTSVTIPTGVTYIREKAFDDCSGLTSVTIPNSVTYIGGWAFSCSGLTSVTIGNSVTSIGVSAFYVCRCLTSITIPNSVTSIGGDAFRGCSGLTSVTIGNSVTSIGESAFYGCSSLTSINVASGNTHYSSIDGVLYNYVQDTLIQCPGAKTSVTIPNSVTSIGESAFDGCRGLTSVTIPNSVTSIGGGAFYGCRGLTSINVASGNTHYSSIDGVLYNYVQDTLIQCPAAKTSVSIPNRVTYIGRLAFYNCSGLTSVSIPTGVTSIGRFAFEDCSGLTTLNFNAINCQDFEAYYDDYYDNYYYPFSGTSLTTVNIGDSVQRIPANFVSGCSGLTSVTIPNSVTSIGDSAFYDCSGLTSVTIPNSVTSIGGGTFYGCSGLTSITIPNGVTSIGEKAFEGCSGLTTLNFNAINCQDFESSYFNGNYYGFGNSLTTVNIGDSVQRIPAYFVIGCSGLVSVVIGDGITNIGRDIFGDCPYLTYLTIGRSVESIENGAFLNCSLLSQITSWASVPPEIGGIDAFPHPNNCTVTVPCGSLGAYTEQTNRWNLLFNGRISEGLSFGLSVSANDEAYGRVEVENHSCESKTLTAIAYNGYVFTGWNDGNTENPRTVTVTSDTAFVAIFTETETTPTITVTVNDATMGSATYTLDGNTAVLTATPNEGYEFTGWNDGNTENPRTVSITSDTAFVAIFTEAVSTPTITVTVNDATMGSATYTMDGNTAVLTATPNDGYSFVIWNDGNTENPRTVTITSDTAFMAIFTEAVSTPTITVTVNDATMGSATYTMDGNTAVLTATPNEGYRFLTWNDGNTENPRTVTVTSDTAFVAIFTETETTPTITVTVNDATMGSATYTMDGNTAVLTATPNEGYRFLTWNDGNMENPRTVTVTSDTTFMAIFTASGSSSLQEVNAREFALYPNPAKSFVTLEFEALNENTLLQILDLNGRRVRTLDLKAGIETLRIDLGDLPKGVYTIMVGNATKKLIVE